MRWKTSLNYRKWDCIRATRKSLRRCRLRHMPHPDFAPRPVFELGVPPQHTLPSITFVGKGGGIGEHPWVHKQMLMVLSLAAFNAQRCAAAQ